MKKLLAFAWLAALALTPALAAAQDVHFRAADGLNSTPVSAATPLPVVDTTPIAAGTAIIGKVGIDQTSNGSTNNVTVDGVQDGVATVSPSVTSATTLVTFTAAQLQGMQSIFFDFCSIGASNVVSADVSSDGGTTWPAGVPVRRVDNTASSLGSAVESLTQSIIAGGNYCIPVAGDGERIRVSTYSSGTVIVRATPKRASCPQLLYGTVTAAATVTGVVGLNSTAAGLPGMGVGQADDVATTACTEDRFCNQRLDAASRALIVRPFESSANAWSFASATSGIVNTTTAVTIKAAGAAGIRNYITSCQVSSDTLGGATELAIRDGAAGTVLWRHKLQTTALAGFPVDFPVPLRGTAATLLEVVTLTAVTGGVYVDCQGFIAP